LIANIDITLITLLENKKIMFAMIDNADRNGAQARDEFPVTLFTRLLNQTLQGKSEAEKAKLNDILSLDSLDRNQLLYSWDKKSDIFMFQPYVIKMFRHLEGHRLEELSDSMLNGLHSQLKGIYNSVVAIDQLDDKVREKIFPWDTQSQDYQESLQFIMSSFREINSRIDDNVKALKSQAKKLSEIADKDEPATNFRTEQVSKALKSIYDLVERYIKPNLEFLNPDVEWRGERNQAPLYLYKQIMNRFGTRQLNKERSAMGRIYQNLIHAAEEIDIVRKSLDIYIKLYKDERLLYNAIEERYNYFYEQVLDLNDGKLNRNKLDPAKALFDCMQKVSGIKTHVISQKALLGFPEPIDTTYLDEHLRTSIQLVNENKENVIEANSTEAVTDNAQHIEDRLRFDAVFHCSSVVKFNDGDDMLVMLHNALQENVDGYTLSDVIDAYGNVSTQLEDENIEFNISEQRKLKYGGGVLTYFPRIYKEVN
jgi:hypothetical protein